MNRYCLILVGASLCAAGLAQADVPAVKKPGTTRSLQAKPVQMPQATSDRDKAGATGFHDKEQDEPTQEHPNPMDAKPARLTPSLQQAPRQR